MIKPLTSSQIVAHQHWNRGYSDAYQGMPRQEGRPDSYYTGYDVGKEDRAEDDEALATGQLDGLSESEREFLYGDEKDRI